MGEAAKQGIAREILAYLAQNPDAQDTLPGIVEWWLLDQGIRIRTAEVTAAIDQLVNDGLVLARTRKDSQTHYQINRRKQSQVLAMIEEGSTDR